MRYYGGNFNHVSYAFRFLRDGTRSLNYSATKLIAQTTLWKGIGSGREEGPANNNKESSAASSSLH